MKHLILFYSRTGTTKKVAQELAAKTGWEICEIFDTKDRSGAIGYLTAGRDATTKKLTTLKPIEKNIADFDTIVIGTPVWGWIVSTPIRTFLEQNKQQLKNVAFYCTMGGSGDVRTFQEMEHICEVKPKTVLALTTKEVLQNDISNKLDIFISGIKI
jgi:flavodoxin